MSDTSTVDPDDFFAQPAFSFASQIRLRELFDEVIRGDRSIAIVLGAGVSLDAGLPTWNQLIENIRSYVENERWRNAIERDTLEPTRKAEYVIRLAQEGRPDTADGIIRNALYKSGSDPKFGALADSLARLTLAVGRTIKILTTNFDTLLEDAIEAVYAVRPDSYPLKEEAIGQWLASSRDPDRPPGVLHAHGILRPGEPPIPPIVLTESTFLKHGIIVRDVISELLRNYLVMFIGVSLADPNLIGPLWDTKSLRNETSSSTPWPFVLLVTDGGGNDEVGDSQMAYSIKRAAFLCDEFKVRTVFSKSYAQQIQIVADLGLAATEPELYHSSQADSLYYGLRFTEALDGCYAHVGCQPGTDMPSGVAAVALSERLHDVLADPNGPLAPVKSFLASVHNSESKRNSLGIIDTKSLDDENFALFLWLRALAVPETGFRPHEIRLVGSSAYTHRQPWSLDRKARIVSFSRHAAAQAMFYGRTHFQNFEVAKDWQLWRSAIAVPFTVSSRRTRNLASARALDNLTVGVVTLNSTHYVQPMRNGEWAQERSAISYLHGRSELDEIILRLGRSMTSFFEDTQT